METPSVKRILEELECLNDHIKQYSTGAFPAFFLQISTVLKIQDILEMQLRDIYFWDDGMIKILPGNIYAEKQITLDSAERKELAWYALQRIPVCGVKETVLDDWLCVNKQGNQLQMQAYRKMLERSSGELSFKENYSVGYLHSLYGYLAIAFGKKTIAEVAREYGVTRYYLLNRIFKGMEIQYLDHIIEQVANII